MTPAEDARDALHKLVVAAIVLGMQLQRDSEAKEVEELTNETAVCLDAALLGIQRLSK